MNQSRRAFLHTTSLLAATLPLARFRLDAAEAPAAVATSGTPAARRGLLFDEADLPRIRANTTDPRFTGLWQKMLAEDMAADLDFLEHHVRLNDQRDDLRRCQNILERTSFIYLVNRDPAQLALAKRAMNRMLDFPDWDCFTEGGKQILGMQRATEGTFALLLALDCLGDAVTPAEREAVEQAVLLKGIPACYLAVYGMKFPDRVKGWEWSARSNVDKYRYISLKRWPLILNSTNLKMVPTACLGIAACYFRGRLPQADAWLELARSSAKAFSTMYGTDGCYDEGVGYWGYTTIYFALYAEVLWRTQGIDDRQLVNFPGTVRYAMMMTDPAILEGGSSVVNFGDAAGVVDVSVASWVQRTQHDPVSQYVARAVGRAGSYLGMFWYEPKAPEAQPEKSLLDHRMANDIVVSRTGWLAPDSVLALRSGGPANHEHADRNSVIFTAYRERLLHDPLHAAYLRTEPRWLLRQTEAHTAVLINGQGHQYHDGSEGTNSSWAVARVIAFATGAGWMTVTSDATEAYSLVNDRVVRVHRTLVFLKPDVVVFLDRVALQDATATVQVRFQAYNDDHEGRITASDHSFTLARPAAALTGWVASTAEHRVRAGRLALDEKVGVFPFAEVSTAAAAEHEIVTVCAALPTGGTLVPLAITRQNRTWHIQGTHAGRTLDVKLTTAGNAAPTVDVAG